MNLRPHRKYFNFHLSFKMCDQLFWSLLTQDCLPFNTLLTTQKHYRSMVSQDIHIKTVFPKPPLIVFRRQNYIRESLIRAKVPPPHTRWNRRLHESTIFRFKLNLYARQFIDRMCEHFGFVREKK